MIFKGKSLLIRRLDNNIAELVFDRKELKINKLDHLTLSELNKAINTLNDDQFIKGLLISSNKKDFIVGADINEFSSWFNMPKKAFEESLLLVHKIFTKIEDLPFPCVTLINGNALGGGFELSLCSDYRIASTESRIGLPEIKLGLFPGWGGSIRLPRLIGLDNALEWITTGQIQKPEICLISGVVDGIVETNQLKEAGLKTLNRCINGELDYEVRREEKRNGIKLNQIEQLMSFKTAERVILGKAGPHYPAPKIILETIQKHCNLHRDKAIPLEIKGFMEVAKTQVATNLIGLFLNEQSLKRQTKQITYKTSKIDTAAVLGVDAIGGGDNDIANSDIVIESLIEHIKPKKTILAKLEANVNKDTVLASNTSLISISELASTAKHPERVCGIRFSEHYPPMTSIPLVEVIRAKKTSDKTIATTVSYIHAIGKKTIVVNDCPGFMVNRVLFSYINAFEKLINEGANFIHIDKVMEQFGWSLGPASLLDAMGTDIASHSLTVMAKGYPDRMATNFNSSIKAIFNAGRLGQKSGSGYYRYELDRRGNLQKKIDEDAIALIDKIISPAHDASKFSNKEIIQRMMLALSFEVVRCLEDKIIDSPEAADMSLIWGLGFPRFRGGVLRYIDSIGAAEFIKLANNYANLGMAYNTPKRLKDMAKTNKKFFTGEANS